MIPAMRISSSLFWALPALVLLHDYRNSLVVEGRLPPLPRTPTISLRGGQDYVNEANGDDGDDDDFSTYEEEAQLYYAVPGPSAFFHEEDAWPPSLTEDENSYSEEVQLQRSFPEVSHFQGERMVVPPPPLSEHQEATSHHVHSPASSKPEHINAGGAFPPRVLEPQASVPQVSEGASMPNEIFNLVKSIVGAGVLGLPAGVAALGGSEMALVPAITMMAIAGLLSAYCFSLIGRACAYTGASSYRQAWERTVGPKSAWIPAAACFMVTSCSVLAYSMILSVTLPSLAKSFLGVIISRTEALIGVTLVALLPLCLMKSLKALGPFSLIGIMGMCYTCVAMGIRRFDGSYGVTGQFVNDLPFDLSPRFGPPEDLADLMTPNLFLLVSMLSTAFMAHYNAPKFYLELKNNTLLRYNTVVGISFFVSLLLFVAVASFGFSTFGKACSGLVLNNYSTNDKLMSLSRVAVALSLLFSYPLAFVGVREGLLDLLKVEKRPDSLQNVVTVLLLSIITWLAYTLTDLRQLLAFSGATWGNAVIYLLPTYMFIQCARKVRPDLRKEVPMAVLTGLIGLFLGMLGTDIALNS